MASTDLLFGADAPPFDNGLDAVDALYLADETECVERALAEARLDAAAVARVQSRAADLVRAVREVRTESGGLDAFLIEYDLSSQEGVVLMCLAEALLRVPDADTADRLIRDKLVSGDWRGHLGGSQSLFVNASTWGLMLTGRLIGPDADTVDDPSGFLSRLVSRAGEPVVRAAMRKAMRIMGHQYVMGRTIDEALRRARDREHRAYRNSFDMLGEAALTRADAEEYFAAYARAIEAIGRSGKAGADVFAAPGISVKLSALHPRYEFAQRTRVLKELAPRLLELAVMAKESGIGFTVDAEEADRLRLSLEVFARVSRSPSLRGWDGYGLAVQAYQKRALALVDWLVELANDCGRRLPVRLVKGAYWDTEIKRAQENGLAGYPVFTRKCATDVSYLACARRLLAARSAVYPQFATHNAHTLASIVEMADGAREFEFQRLHGMGEALYAEVVDPDRLDLPCRVYAPVGSHEDLLPYLVRRLLENGANTSFVNRIVDEDAPIEEIIADPVAQADRAQPKPHPRIALPADLYGEARRNSAGVNLADPAALTTLATAVDRALTQSWSAAPLIGGKAAKGAARDVVDPSDRSRVVGRVVEADAAAVDAAAAAAVAAQPVWNARRGAARAAILEAAAERFEAHAAELCALCVREAGKTLPDAVAELREAVDFLRYYAVGCRRDFAGPVALPGPTGEANSLTLDGRGVFVCISPWNFPLAIFTGQVAAALAAGNTVLAKPAEQTPLVAALACRLLFEAGVPPEALHLLPGDGLAVGARAVADPRIAGVAFTGSTQTAMAINRSLAARDGAIATLIAETGGQNAMIVDSSALPEQVVLDVVRSAFGSAGQRCSALRVLFVQE
ncbi:MAG: bifunctional proline dehydrogenase/L-glutamate gamma-semialdehyde dehydrogenase PutA, partial [Pseudomonadota bacterium]